MTKSKSDEDYCCYVIIFCIIISVIITYWYVILPIFVIIFIIFCIYINNKDKPNKKTRYKSTKKKKEKQETIKKSLKINPQYYKDVLKQKCPYCNLISYHNVCKFCGHDRRNYSGIQLHALTCSYCNTVVSQYGMVCDFCGHSRRKIEIKEKEKKSRRISISVQREVWRRDEGRCVECGTKEKLEYDHIIPFSRGGSNTVRNIQLLCESCNRKKSNNI